MPASCQPLSIAGAAPGPGVKKEAGAASPLDTPNASRGIEEWLRATTPLLRCGKIPTFLQEVDP